MQPLERNSRSERGETLVEVLVTIVILGMAITALLGGLLTTTTSSVVHRSSTSIDAAVASFAEAARNAIELNGPSGSGPEFTACATSSQYTVAGSPMPSSGPVGTQIAVLGTGVAPSSGRYTGATFNGTAVAGGATAATGSTSSGGISLITVPSEPAGTYNLTPLDGSHPAATPFTVTPWVGPMSAATPGSTGPGPNVKVSVTGFTGDTTKSLTVNVGSKPVTPISGGHPLSNGTSNLVFTIPKPLSGDQSTQQVTITDGINTSPPVTLGIATDTALADPLPSASVLNNGYFRLTVNVSYWTNSGWGASCTGSGANQNIQQFSIKLLDSQPNNGADGGQSIVVANLAPQGTPAPPVWNIETGGNGQVSLSWFAPTYQGSSAITGYNVFYGTASGSESSPGCSTSSTSCTVSSLTAGENYYFVVTATNSVGNSAKSTEATATTLPGAPSGPHETGGNQQVAVSWAAPSNGDAPITGYDVWRSTTSGSQGSLVTSGGCASPVSSTNCTDTSLLAGEIYYYEVAAINSTGTGPASAQTSGTTTPGQPSGLTAAPGNNQTSLSWTAPSPNGDAPITSYKVYRSTTAGSQGTVLTSGGCASPIGTSCTDTTAANGTPYYYEVTAVNAGGEGQPSSQVSVKAGTPLAPTGLTATAGSNCPKHGTCTYFVNLSWSVPASNGTPSVLTYNIYRSTTAGTQGSLLTTVTTPTFQDATVSHGTPYYYEVAAVNTNGEGPASNQATATP